MTIRHLVNVGKTNPKQSQNKPKQSQMQKSQNEHKYCFNKELQRKMNNEGLRKTKPNQTQKNQEMRLFVQQVRFSFLEPFRQQPAG